MAEMEKRLGRFYDRTVTLMVKWNQWADLNREECRISHSVARLLNSFQSSATAVIPLRSTSTVDSIKKYGAMWACGLCYAVRLLTPHPVQGRDDYSMIDEDWWDECLPTLKGTSDQQMWVRAVLEVTENLAELEDGEEWDGAQHEGRKTLSREQELQRWQQRLDTVILGLSMSLISHPLENYRFQSPLLSYAAIRALATNGSWMHPFQYTPFLSGMVKSAQLVLMAQALQEHTRQANDERRWLTLEKQTERLVRQWLANDRDTPLAELNMIRLYGQKIARTSLPPFMVSWSRDQQTVAYRDKMLHLGRWRAHNQGLLRRARTLLDKELLLGFEDAPRVLAHQLQDVMTESRPGYHFVNDPRNGLSEQQGWLWQRLSGSLKHLERFARVTNVPGERKPRLQWKESVVQQYQRHVVHFTEAMLLLVHLTAGLPARAPELVRTSYRNTENARNVMVQDGSMVILTMYHKMQHKVGQRPVYRFLAPAVGDVLASFITVVLPFARYLQSQVSSKSVERSVFLFS